MHTAVTRFMSIYISTHPNIRIETDFHKCVLKMGREREKVREKLQNVCVKMMMVYVLKSCFTLMVINSIAFGCGHFIIG